MTSEPRAFLALDHGRRHHRRRHDRSRRQPLAPDRLGDDARRRRRRGRHLGPRRSRGRGRPDACRRARPAPRRGDRAAAPRGRQPPAAQAGRHRRLRARARAARGDRVAQRLADGLREHRADGPARDDDDAARRERPRRPRRRGRSARRGRTARTRRAGRPGGRRGRAPARPRHRPRRRHERPPARVRGRRPPEGRGRPRAARHDAASRADRWPTSCSSSPCRPTTPIARSAGARWPSPTCSTGAWTSSRSATTRAPAPRPCPVSAARRPRATWPSSRAPASPRPTPTTRWSTGSGSGRHGAPTGIACATGCASCGSLRGRMRPGDGATLRLAAARAALSRLAEWTPDWDDRPPADLTVAAGGAWAVAAAPTIALALVDVLRRPGAGQYALDHARILAPLGSIPDADERRAMVADLVDDLLAPLGTVVTPAGMRNGRSAGSVVVHGRDRRDPARPRRRAGSPSSTCRPARRPSPSSRSGTRSGWGPAAGTSRSR